jgi:hypothetical protein
MKTMGFRPHRSVEATPSIDTKDAFEHTLFSGATGNGKTSCGIYPILKSRIEAGYGMLIYDEKAKEHRSVKYLAHQCGRLEDVIEIGKPHGHYLNILSNMSEKQLEKFAHTLIKESSDPFWSDGGSTLMVDIINYLTKLKSLHAYARKAFGIDDFDMLQSTPDVDNRYELEIPTTTLTMKELGRYVKILKNYIMLVGKSEEYVRDIVKKSIAAGYTNGLDPIQMNLKLQEFDDRVYELNQITETLKGSQAKNSPGEASGFNGLVFMIAASISSLIRNEYINEPDALDIADLLNQGKIVIINTESFPNSVLSIMLDKTLDYLAMRAKYHNPHPISIVIDEANRVLGRESDVRTDILRSSKVEIIMAIQNDEQMIRKMGNVYWEAMKQNFKTQISFQGKTDHPQVFKAYDEISQSELTMDAIFFDESKLDATELIYQKIHNHYQTYIQNEYEILVYDHLHFSTLKQLIFRNIKTNEERQVRYIFPIPGKTRRISEYMNIYYALHDQHKELRLSQGEEEHEPLAG